MQIPRWVKAIGICASEKEIPSNYINCLQHQMADVLNFLPNTDLYNNGIDYLRGKTSHFYNGRHLYVITFVVGCLENVMFASQIFFCLCCNVLIPADEKNFRSWYTERHCFFSILMFFTTRLQFKVRAQVWFKCRSSIVPFGHSKIEFKNSIKD